MDIIDELLAILGSEGLRPGSKLPSERDLAERFGVGRSALREAIKSLSMLGLVETRQGAGNYISTEGPQIFPSLIHWSLLLNQGGAADLIECREHIEVITAQLAAARCADDDLEIMSDHLVEMDNPTDLDSYMQSDVAFHLAIANAAGNEVFVSVLKSVQSLMRIWIAKVVHDAEDTSIFTDQHRAIYVAIKNGDPDAAAAAMRSHLVFTHGQLDRAMHLQAGGGRTAPPTITNDSSVG